jgi:acetolactate synthase-1/2/3 large subunit
VKRMRTGADLVLDVLDKHGVEIVFGYPGGAIMPLHNALHNYRVRHVLVRHEAAAAFAASGYARATGRTGVCIATSGPGATNLVTGIADAMLDNVPLVAITGQVKAALMGTDAFQEVDIAAITHAVTKRNIVVRSVEDLAPALEGAFALARGRRPGPVLVDIPSDVLKANADADAARRARGPEPVLSNVEAIPQGDSGENKIDAAAIAAAAQALRTARKPVFIAGGGVRWSGAVAQFRALCARTGVPHTATLQGLGSADQNDERFLGMLGMHGWTAANRAVEEADVIFALGMRFDDRVTGNPKRFAPNARTIVHFDIDASEFDKNVPAKIKVHGDLQHSLCALNDALASIRLPSFARWERHASQLGGPLPRDSAQDGHLCATDVLDAFVARAPRDAIVTTDVGQHQMWAAQRVRPFDPHSFMSSGGLGSMGFGFPAAIGAAFAHPRRPVFAIVGDGGFQMSFAELATLRRYRLPVKILLIDNRNLGMVRQWQELFYSGRYAATSLWDNPDFCALASAFGTDSLRVDNAGDLQAAMQRFVTSPDAMLLHAACYPAGMVFPMIPSGMGVAELIEAAPA